MDIYDDTNLLYGQFSMNWEREQIEHLEDELGYERGTGRSLESLQREKELRKQNKS